jgi:hypothetical protein
MVAVSPDQGHLTVGALPGLAVSDRGVDKALTLRDAFSILDFSDAKDADRKFQRLLARLAFILR